MKVGKIVINIIIVGFILLGIYFYLNDKVAYGPLTRRNGSWQRTPITSFSLFFFAFVFIIIRIVLNKADKK